MYRWKEIILKNLEGKECDVWAVFI
jgi:hypothetical protein